jgi:hypothetical protein
MFSVVYADTLSLTRVTVEASTERAREAPGRPGGGRS